MSLITRARVKIPSGLQVMQREDPISAQTMTRNKAHIPEPSVSVSQIPRDNVAKEGGETKEEIEHFTSVPEDTAQPFSQECARASDCLDHKGGVQLEGEHSLAHFSYIGLFWWSLVYFKFL